jgi:GMP reductase
MRIENDPKLDFRDVLIRPKRSKLASRQEVDLSRSFVFKHSKRFFNGLPIIAANMDGVGTISMARAFYEQNHGATVALKKAYDKDQLVSFYRTTISSNAWFTIGMTDADWDKLAYVEGTLNDLDITDALDKICIDVANGYSEVFLDRVKQLRETYPYKTIMAGNVVTGDMVEALILAGADVVKVGIGPGSVCTTRKMTGVGYPQLSAIIECADAAHGLGALVCGDGGCQSPGDIAKAFGGGADFIMLGGMLAGHNEGEYGVTMEKGGGSYKFYGMSSDTAQLIHEGSVRSYRASEGKTVKVDAKGDVEATMLEIQGGLRSACTYVGAEKLKELSKRTTFVTVNRQLNDMFSD